MQHPFRLKRSARAKNARILVTADGVDVIVPLKTPAKWVQLWVNAKQVWIDAQVTKLKARAANIRPLAPAHYTDGALIPYAGRHYPLTLHSTPRKRCRVEFNDGFTVFVPVTNVTPVQQHVVVQAALQQWLKTAVKAQVQLLIAQHAPKQQLWPQTIRIKQQKTRWGSCGGNNDININWLLILAPPSILEYVLVHELCHIREKNHSARFWALVAEHLPDYQQHRNWLKQHGASLKM